MEVLLQTSSPNHVSRSTYISYWLEIRNMAWVWSAGRCYVIFSCNYTEPSPCAILYFLLFDNTDGQGGVIEDSVVRCVQEA